MKCRFQGFIDIASFFNKFLKMYQTDAPMVPFMADDLECLTRRLLKCVLKKSVLDKAITPFSVSSINLFSDKKKTVINENCLPMTKSEVSYWHKDGSRS